MARASRYLAGEVESRNTRDRRILRKTDFEPDELEQLLTAQEHQQKWALFYTERGGLPIPDRDGLGGVIPCSSMRNHGVAWRRAGDVTETWLLTARKSNRGWDMGCDVGHESAHAAFAPVPLFVDSGVMRDESSSLVDVDAVADLEPEHIIRMLYFYSEIAVVAIRGEGRSTNTGLPIDDPEELNRLVSISDELFPGFGFERALAACARFDNYFDPQQSDSIFKLAAPILRVLPKVNQFVDAMSPPSVGVLRAAVNTEALAHS